MGRYTGPVCRRCRQVGIKLFLKGDRCLTPKCAVDKRRTPPGQNVSFRRRPTEAGLRLREKQKARYTYGLMEKQFAKLFEKAKKQSGVTGERFVEMLELRLDNVVYRLNFSNSRNQAREMVRSGHISVNEKRLDIPSAIIKPGDIVSWNKTAMEKDFVKVLTQGIPKRPVPGWLALDAGALTGTVLTVPQAADMDQEIDTRLIVEYYSR